MNSQEVEELAAGGIFPSADTITERIETGISWVLLGKVFAYKIKKPVKYSFVDFSSLERRKFYCEEELRLNRRLTSDIYLNVLPVVNTEGNWCTGTCGGEAEEYLVQMQKLDPARQMDTLLQNSQVSRLDIKKIAEVLFRFHEKAEIIPVRSIVSDLKQEFNDIISVQNFLSAVKGKAAGDLITACIEASDSFLEKYTSVLEKRVADGFVKDCHGDLHSRNIFLYETPVIFDCIEFNERFRHIDVLKEISFLCMDLDAFNREDLSIYFTDCYLQLPMSSDVEQLFLYYKCLHANVRAKVYALKAMNNSGEEVQADIAESLKYLNLMDKYRFKLKF
jgi:uncharacterized protein